jgi:hypothetical protein
MKDSESPKKGAGGTPGGVGSFFLGLIMAISGGYLLTNQVRVTSTFWGYRFGLFGGATVSAFGITLIPFLIGVGLVFFNGRSKLGWLLSGGSLLVIFVGIIANLRVYFASASLYVTLIMLILLVGGLGLIARSLRPSG